MKKIKKFLPLEFYFLLLPSIFIFLFSLLYLRNFSINVFKTEGLLTDSSPFILFFSTLLLILLIATLILLCGVILDAFFSIFNKRVMEKEGIVINYRNVLSVFLAISLIVFVTYSMTLFTDLLFKVANPINVTKFSNIALSWDRAIFKVDPGIWLINKFGGTFVEKILLWDYNSLFLVLSFVLLLSFFFSKKSFRRLILLFFISWMIAMPIWFLFPAISPDFMFRLNSLGISEVGETKAFNSFVPSNQLKEDLEFQEKINIVSLDPGKIILPISTFPSMHAAWGIAIAYSGTILCPWLGIFLVPWAILDCVGAVYILEHFAVDIFLGVIVALISIIITEILFRFENKYFEDKFKLLSGLGCAESAMRKIWTKLNFIKFFKNKK